MRRCIFHGVSFQCGDRIFLLTGPSGVGKTTQFSNLKRLHPDNIHILNGDKPILRFEKDRIYVEPSPWMGKEKLGSGKKGKLDAVIYLKQGQKNAINKPPLQEMILPIVSQFVYSGREGSIIKSICALADRLLRAVPVFVYENTGTEASSMYLYNKLLRETSDDV